MNEIERKRRATVGLATFRMALGVALATLPWLIGEGLDGYGATQVAEGATIVAIAPWMHRWPRLRLVQGVLALAVLFLPFAFDTTDMQIYFAVFSGKLLLLSAIVTPEIFKN